MPTERHLVWGLERTKGGEEHFINPPASVRTSPPTCGKVGCHVGYRFFWLGMEPYIQVTHCGDLNNFYEDSLGGSYIMITKWLHNAHQED